MIARLLAGWQWLLGVLGVVGLLLLNTLRLIWQRNRVRKQLEQERANREWAEALKNAQDELLARSRARREKAQEEMDADKMPDHLRNPRKH